MDKYIKYAKAFGAEEKVTLWVGLIKGEGSKIKGVK